MVQNAACSGREPEQDITRLDMKAASGSKKIIIKRGAQKKKFWAPEYNRNTCSVSTSILNFFDIFSNHGCVIYADATISKIYLNVFGIAKKVQGTLVTGYETVVFSIWKKN